MCDVRCAMSQPRAHIKVYYYSLIHHGAAARRDRGRSAGVDAVKASVDASLALPVAAIAAALEFALLALVAGGVEEMFISWSAEWKSRGPREEEREKGVEVEQNGKTERAHSKSKRESKSTSGSTQHAATPKKEKETKSTYHATGVYFARFERGAGADPCVVDCCRF